MNNTLPSISEIVIGGGVSANSEMRKLLKELSSEKNWNVYIPPIEYTTDNAAMIGIVGYFKYIHNKFDQLNITPSPRFKI